MYSLIWLADVLRAAGCSVVEEPGWKDRGRGEMGEVRGVLCHDTAGPRTGDSPSLATVRDGRLNGPDPLPGPLSQLFLSRSGVFHVVAAGLCNHAGKGQWHGVTEGNHQLIGIEAENCGDGQDPWPTGQLEAYELGTAAILKHIGADSVMAAGHKEYALPRGRKVDPTFDMISFRQHVENLIGLGASVPLEKMPIADLDPKRAMLRKGDQGQSVRQLQTLLQGLKVDGGFGPATELAVKAFQSAHGLKADGLVGPATWKALGV
jgi:hypothetical protein